MITIQEGKLIEVLDLTPTWQGILPALIITLTDGNADGRRIAKEELLKMARAADAYNELIGEGDNLYINSQFAADLAGSEKFTQVVTHGYLIEPAQDREGYFWGLTIYANVDGGEDEIASYQYKSKQDAEQDIDTAIGKSIYDFESI